MKTIIFCLAASLFLFNSCKYQKSTKDDEQNHNYDAVSFQYTKYNSDIEIFIESEPFVAGQTSVILAHITKLADFKPLEKGVVTASLIVGTKGIRQKLDKPTRTGIYIFNLQPEVTGKGKLIFNIQTADSNYSVTISDIQVFANQHDAKHEAGEATIANSNAITFTKEQSWKVEFATGLPNVEPFSQIIKTTARVQSAPGDEMILTATTNGIVTFKGNNLTEGMQVSSGKSLLIISGENLADNNTRVRFNEAKNNFEKTEANYKRISLLAKDQIVSQKELLEAKNNFDNAEVIYENLKNNFNEGGQNITSTKTGFIKHLYVVNGQYVEAGEPLITITQNKNLFLKAEVQQKYAKVLPFINSATIRSLSDNTVYNLEELNGKIVSYGKNISDENYLIPVTLQVENRDGIFPGSFMEVYLKAQSKTNALTVLNTAILEEQGNYSVYVQLTPESFEKREVKVGNTDGIKTEILSGLSAKDRIVTRGAILVKLASVSNSIDPHAGHVH